MINLHPLINIIWRNVAGIIVSVILIILLFSQCSENNRLVGSLAAANTENTTYRNKLGTVTTQAATQKLTIAELETAVIEKDHKMKVLTAGFSKIKTINRTTTITRIDTVKIPFDLSVPCNFTRNGAVFTEYYSLGYVVDSLGLTIEPIVIPNEQITITGFRKKWLLGREIAVTEVTNTNPLIEITNVNSYETVVQKKWYDTRLFNMLAGAAIFAGFNNLTQQ
jgi:hypothetical protein